jgi:hypothetical protein
MGIFEGGEQYALSTYSRDRAIFPEKRGSLVKLDTDLLIPLLGTAQLTGGFIFFQLDVVCPEYLQQDYGDI